MTSASGKSAAGREFGLDARTGTGAGVRSAVGSCADALGLVCPPARVLARGNGQGTWDPAAAGKEFGDTLRWMLDSLCAAQQ